MFNRSRHLSLVQGLGLVLAGLGSRLGMAQMPMTQKPRRPGAAPTSARATPAFLKDMRRWRLRWAPAGGGHRECARRRRQIAAGQLTSASGLVRLAEAREVQP